MSRDLKIAVGASALYAGIEIWLGQKYPLKSPVSLPLRMAVAGGLTFLTVMLAEKLVGGGTVHCGCGWSWDVVDDDPNPLLCHKCGSRGVLT